jgi:hypothetical protein
VLYLALMKRFIGILPFLIVIALPLRVYAVTPIPTKQIIQLQKSIINNNLFKVIATATVTPTVTVTPTSTSTVTPTATTTVAPTLTGTIQATVTPMISQSIKPTVTSTPMLPVQVKGFTTKDILFGILVAALLVILIVQANWAKIKAWMHKKTE